MITIDKPNVTLIRGPIVTSLKAINNPAVPSITLAYLSANLMSAGYDVTWVDAIADGLNNIWESEKYPGYVMNGLNIDQIVESIPTNAKVIGLNAMFSSEWPISRDLIQAIRKAFPNTTLIAGGEHITSLTEHALRDCPELDACIRGEGEDKFLNFVDQVVAGSTINSIKGICFIDEADTYREGGGLDRVRDLETIPWPWWPDGYLEKFWAASKSAGAGTGRDMPMLLSRGCPYQCTFCSSPNMWTTRYVLRDIDDTINEIKHYINKYGIKSIQLYDLTAITKKKWIVEFCNRLIAENINLKWSVPQGTRSETLDEETLSLLKKTGCHYLVYAPESGSEITLKTIKKRIKLPRLISSIKTAKKTGLTLRVNLIIGFPNETRKNIYQTMLFGLKMSIIGVDEVSVNIFSPYPGSELFSELHADGVVSLDDNYFLSLSKLNSEYLSLSPTTVISGISTKELAAYRIFTLLAGYTIGYLSRPYRIVRTLKTIFSDRGAHTVFEQRLRDFIQLRKWKNRLSTN